jgi:predicted LPLAT superfamily acyltransferase
LKHRPFKSLLRKAEALGHGIFYFTLYLTGQIGAYVLLVPVVFTYLMFSRRIHHLTAQYISRRFPESGPLRRWLHTYRIVLSFGQVLVDKAWLRLKKKAHLNEFFDRPKAFLRLIGDGKGLVLVTAHVGNWQTALANLNKLPVTVHVLMQYEEGTVPKPYFEIQDGSYPFKIINCNSFMGGMIEATAAIQRGEIVTVMGDRMIKGPYATVEFLGDKVRIPTGAYRLAAATQAPVVVLLAAKTGRQDFELRVWDTFYPK